LHFVNFGKERMSVDVAWLAERFSDARPLDMPAGGAAILVPFVPEVDGWHLLFIRRADQAGDPHSGQVAFPGGRFEPADRDAVACALRETAEEIGLPPQDITVVGGLELQRTHLGYPVVPVVGVSRWPRPIRLDHAEVADWFTVPVHWLADRSNLEPIEYGLADGSRTQVEGFRDYRGQVIWGLTARVVLATLAQLRPIA
jgi:8-oxo-dGTP pyrophosphatase MutT (NUDIX family)